MEKYTQNDLDFITDLGSRICRENVRCTSDCPFAVVKNNMMICTFFSVKDFLLKKMVKTNADKFKEVFGFPLYEVHQLSAQEEGEWLEHEYQEPDKTDEE